MAAGAGVLVAKKRRSVAAFCQKICPSGKRDLGYLGRFFSPEASSAALD